MRLTDRLLLGLAACFCVLGIAQATIDIAMLLGHALPMAEFLETRYILAAVPALTLACSRDPHALLDTILAAPAGGDSRPAYTATRARAGDSRSR
ncbi:MAG: hypothetical protein KDH20_18560 [Rhodocyclaceae bacterium]|nr:hypothetical protein [Rhodocyclaceae bacterium]